MKLNYRRDIDGLRAVAVISVILYHGNFSLFNYPMLSGGYLGVDIFFVISGYLISSIIIHEIINTGSFSFSYFYQRRIRRIVPVFLFMIIISLPFAWIIFYPHELISYSKSVIYSLFFFSNFFFWQTSISYFALESFNLPLLHTWSLSIEEQFYIFFPIFVIFIFKFNKKFFFIYLIIFFILSLLVSDYASRNHPSFNYYMIFTRAWELLAGSILAYLEIIKKKRTNFNTDNNNFLTFFGFVLIILSLLFFDSTTRHPSLLTFIPIFGVCLIIWFSFKEEIVTKILSSKFLVGIGLISYSLYLWHFIIFTFIYIYFDIEKIPFYWLIIIFFISTLSYFFIEKPFRNKKNDFKNIFFLLIFFSVIIFIINLIIIYNKGFIERFRISNNYILDKNYYMNENNNFEFNYIYKFLDNDKLNVLIVGNSHAEDLMEIFSFSKKLNDTYNFNLVSPIKRDGDYNYQISCFYNFLLYNSTYCENSENKEFTKNIETQYKNSNVVLLSTRWLFEDMKYLEKIVNIVKKDNKTLVIIDNLIQLDTYTQNNWNILDYFVSKNKRIPDQKELIEIEKQTFKQLESYEKINLELEKFAIENSIKFLSKKDFLCDQQLKRCDVMTDKGFKIFWDHAHITSEGAKYLSKKIDNISWFNLK